MWEGHARKVRGATQGEGSDVGEEGGARGEGDEEGYGRDSVRKRLGDGNNYQSTFYTGNSDDAVSIQMTQNEVYEQKPEALIQAEQNVVYGVTIPPRNLLQQGPDSLQLTPAVY